MSTSNHPDISDMPAPNIAGAGAVVQCLNATYLPQMVLGIGVALELPQRANFPFSFIYHKRLYRAISYRHSLPRMF
jgi:hypothetical protein